MNRNSKTPCLSAMGIFLLVVSFGLQARASYDLQVTITGSGAIEFSPSGTSCGQGCYRYANWTLVTLTPVPEPGWSFDRWDGAGSGSNNRYVLMDGDKSITAYFSQDSGTATQIDVATDQVINPSIIGLGLNFATAFVPRDQSVRQDFFDLLKDSGASWIRIVPQYYEWENRNNDDSNPWTQPSVFLSGSFGGCGCNMYHDSNCFPLPGIILLLLFVALKKKTRHEAGPID